MTDDSTLRQALAYARRGWPVFPCLEGQKVPATRHGFRDATTDEQQITGWFGRDPGLNVAIATGAPGPDVLDVDVHGAAGNGYVALGRLHCRVHAVPDAPHLLEQRERLAGHVAVRQPDHVAAQLLQGGVPDVALLGQLGVLASVVRGHLHLSSDPGAARNGLLEPTVGDRRRCHRGGHDPVRRIHPGQGRCRRGTR